MLPAGWLAVKRSGSRQDFRRVLGVLSESLDGFRYGAVNGYVVFFNSRVDQPNLSGCDVDGAADDFRPRRDVLSLALSE